MHRIELVIVNFLSVKFLDCFIATIYCTEPPADNFILKNRTHYTDEDRANIIKIFQETHTGEKGHNKRIKERWDEIHGRKMPQTGHNLYRLAVRWIQKGNSEQKETCPNPPSTQKRTKWTSQMKESVVRFYYQTNPDKWDQMKRIKELWDREYPEHTDIKAATLLMKVRDLLRVKGEEFNMKKKQLTEEEQIDLVKCYQKSLKYKSEHWKIMRELFIKKHPQYAKLRSSNLRDKVHLILQNNPEIEKKILGSISGFDKFHSPRELGETSGLNRGEPTSIRTTHADIFPGALEIEETSSLDHHALHDVDTSHNIIHADLFMNQYVPTEAGASHQYISGYFDDPLSFPNTVSSHQSSSVHPDDAGKGQQTIHSGKAWERVNNPCVGMSHQVIHSKQSPSNENQRKSSKGKEPILD